VANGSALHQLCTALAAGAAAVIDAEPEITALDMAVGDGDAGIAMCKGGAATLALCGAILGSEQCTAALAAHLPQGASDHISRMLAPWAREGVSGVLYALSVALNTYMGGTSGILFSVFASAARAGVEQSATCTIASAFSAGVAALQTYGGAQAGMCTMVDALLPAAAALHEAENHGVGGDEGLSAALSLACAAATSGAAGTTTMRTTIGRGAYAAEAGHAAAMKTPDAGAVAVAHILKGVAAVMQAPP
jgi:dihydroxyacetone kinase